ncbi:hypothetical protein CR513_28411, partial [Mucuna pruriens]
MNMNYCPISSWKVHNWLLVGFHVKQKDIVIYGLNYGDTFSPVAKMAFACLFLSMAAMRHWPLERKSIWSNHLGLLLKGSLVIEDLIWFKIVTSSLFDMICCEANHSIFFKRSPLNKLIYIYGVHIGRLRYVLGIKVAQSKIGIAISQRKDALDILKETWMRDCKPIDTPMDLNISTKLGGALS